MTKSWQVLLLVIYLSICAHASTLRGLVLANEESGPPVAGVQVSGIGANATETGASGSFVLEFPHAVPGDRVHITVNKPGYVVVNYVQLSLILPKNSDLEPLLF